MITYALASLAGFALLIVGADRFVMGAAGAARNLGVPPLLIGLTIVGLATSTPEIMVSIMAAADGETDLAVGNALGSNIANIALVLGATALITPLEVRSVTLRREMPALLAVTLLSVMLFLDLTLSFLDGVILMGSLVLVMYWIVTLTVRTAEAGDPIESEFEAEIPANLSMGSALGLLAVGLVVMLVGSHSLVWGAHNLALAIGVSDLIIGVTVVAIGTSLPELAVSVVSALKKEHGLAIGNIIGSNMFNSLAVVGVAGLIHPMSFEPEVLLLHFPVMIALTLVLFAMTYTFDKGGRISRPEGGVLLLVFFGYHTYLLQR